MAKKVVYLSQNQCIPLSVISVSLFDRLIITLILLFSLALFSTSKILTTVFFNLTASAAQDRIDKFYE